VEPDSVITRKVETYFARIGQNSLADESPDSLSRCFAAFHLYGTVVKGDVVEAHGISRSASFSVRNWQVFDGASSSGPVIAVLREGRNGLEVIGHRERGCGCGFGHDPDWDVPESIVRIAKADTANISYQRESAQITSFYAPRLSNSRFVSRPRPLYSDERWPGAKDIYSRLNLTVMYDAVSLVPARDKLRPYDPPPWTETSDDGRYIAWRRDGIFIWDTWTDSIFILHDTVRNHMSDPMWKDSRVVALRQENGCYGDWWGVHLEYDMVRRELVWAVPYGPLGFAKRDSLPPPAPAYVPTAVPGRVLDADTRTPPESASVLFRKSPVPVDSDGRFTLADFPAGRHLLVVSAPGYQTREVLYTAYGDGRDSVCVRLWATSTYGSIAGTVSDDSTGEPVGHGDVLADGSGLRAPIRDGLFQLDGVRPGRRTVTVRINGYTMVDTVLKVRAGQTTRCMFRLSGSWSEWE